MLTASPTLLIVKSMRLITQEELKRRVRINPETGECFDLRGKPIGSKTWNGYLRATINRREYRLHRLIWLWVHGEHVPKNMTIDHINGNKTDNRIDNLRVVTQLQNTYFHYGDSDMRNIFREGNRYCVEMLFQGKRIRRRTKSLEKAMQIRSELYNKYPPLCVRANQNV